MAGWLPHNRSSSVMAERSFSESEPAATSSEAPALHRNRLDVRGPEVKVRVNIGSDFGLLSHAYEFRVHDMAQWLDRWDVDAVKKNAQTYLNERLDFRFRRRHVKVELWLPTYQRWEPLPYDAQFQEVATRYDLDRRQEYWDFMLRLAHGRTVENCGDW